MANKKLLSYNLDELKEKFIRFYFEIGGFFSGYEAIEVIKNDEKIMCTYIHKRKMKINFSNEKWNEFVCKIFENNIHKWKETYYDHVLDGTQWNLEMEFNGLTNFDSYGSNKYPKNWKKFGEIIVEYFPQMKYIRHFVRAGRRKPTTP